MSGFIWMASCGFLVLFGFALIVIKRSLFKKPEHSESPSQAAEATLEDLKRWNWGAFFLTWVVGVFLYKHIVNAAINSSGQAAAFFPYMNVALLVLIPAISILLGFKGNASFWKSKKWKSVNEFHKQQKKFAAIGGIICLIYVGGFLLGTWASFSLTRSHAYQDSASLIRKNPEIQNRLGVPIQTFLPVNFHHEKSLIAFNYLVNGPRGSGMVIVYATKLKNDLRYVRHEFIFAGVQKKKISVYP